MNSNLKLQEVYFLKITIIIVKKKKQIHFYKAVVNKMKINKILQNKKKKIPKLKNLNMQILMKKYVIKI